MNENELIRRTVLEYLALRPTAAYEVPQITRMINMHGMLDMKLQEHHTSEALAFLLGMDYVSVQHGGLGSSKNWQVTSPGILYHERGE